MVELPHPLRLRDDAVWGWRLRAAAWFVAAATLLCVDVSWWGGAARDLRTEQRAWRHGTLVRDVSISGEPAHISFFAQHEQLQVRFVDDFGASHEGREDFYTLWGHLDRFDRAIVRFDGRDFALNWSIDAAFSRWTCIVFAGGLLMFLAWLSACAGLRELAMLARARRCAAGGELVELEVVGVEGARYRYQFEEVIVETGAGYRQPGARQSLLTGMAVADDPMFADAARSRLVAVRSLHDLVILRKDRHPFL